MSWIRLKQEDKPVWINGVRVSYVTEAERSGVLGTNIVFERGLNIVVDETLEQVAGALREASAVDIR